MWKGAGEGRWAKVGTSSSGVLWGHTAGQPDPPEAREGRSLGGGGFPDGAHPQWPLCCVSTVGTWRTGRLPRLEGFALGKALSCPTASEPRDWQKEQMGLFFHLQVRKRRLGGVAQSQRRN